MQLINCEINQILIWSEDCILTSRVIDNEIPEFRITIQNYVAVLSLSVQENVEPLLKPGFKRTVNWNKYQSKVSVQAKNRYLNFLINPNFQGADKNFDLLFENNTCQIIYNRCFFATVTKKL